MDRYLVVLAGAAIGGLARYIVATAIMSKLGGRFPFGTLAVNLSGSFLIGLVMVLVTERLKVNPNWRLFLVTGVLGGYTTFSAFEYETYMAMQAGQPWLATIYVATSVLVGYAAVWLGAWAGRL